MPRVSDIEACGRYSAPTQTFKNSYKIASDDFTTWLSSLKIVNSEIELIEKDLDANKAHIHQVDGQNGSFAKLIGSK